jgi:predicted transposase/invertase (TIGR01784 family)
MTRFLDPRTDIVFKRIFGEHPEILCEFLNGMLPFEDDSEFIVSLEYLPGEQVPDIPLFKNSIVDVRCKDAGGRQFIVEMQMAWTNAFLQRVLFNASKAYVRQLEKGENYEALCPVYGLSLLDDTFDKDSEATTTITGSWRWAGRKRSWKGCAWCSSNCRNTAKAARKRRGNCVGRG